MIFPDNPQQPSNKFQVLPPGHFDVPVLRGAGAVVSLRLASPSICNCPGPCRRGGHCSVLQVHLVAGDPEALLGHQLQLLDLRLANATAVLSLEVCLTPPWRRTATQPCTLTCAVPCGAGCEHLHVHNVPRRPCFFTVHLSPRVFGCGSC
jgi:hypothetical protein